MLNTIRLLLATAAVALTAVPAGAETYAVVGKQAQAAPAEPLDLFHANAALPAAPKQAAPEVVVAGPARPVGTAPAVRLSPVRLALWVNSADSSF